MGSGRALVILIAAMLVESDSFLTFEKRTGVFWEHALLAFVILPNSMGAFLFFCYVNRITAAARHANG